MVYLALTPQGLQEILGTPEAAKATVWCGAMWCPKLNLRSWSVAISPGSITRSRMPNRRQFNVPYRQSKSITRESTSGLRVCFSRTDCAVWEPLVWVIDGDDAAILGLAQVEGKLRVGYDSGTLILGSICRDGMDEEGPWSSLNTTSKEASFRSCPHLYTSLLKPTPKKCHLRSVIFHAALGVS
jgi:hypothetical protein